MAKSEDEVRERLERLEAKVERLLTLLEGRGNGHDRSAPVHAAPLSNGGLATLGEAAAHATTARAELEGSEAFGERMHEAVLALTEPETLASLVRAAELMPRLEWAIQGGAAAPALLEDFLQAARESFEERGASDPAQSLDAATDALFALSRPQALEALGRLGAIAPHLTGLAAAAADATEARAKVEGEEALQARLREAVLEITDPEVLDSLVRIAQLTPKLEFAVYGAAAAPALLEDFLASVREDAPDHQARLDAGVELLQRASSPEVLSSLARLTDLLPELAGQDAGDTLERLAGHLPTLEKAAQVAGWVPAAIEAAAQEAGHEDLRGIEPLLRAGVVLVLKLVEPETLRALSRLAEQSPHVAPLLDRLSGITSEVNLEGLADVFVAAARPDVQNALAHFLNVAPTLVPVIEALPVQARTLEVLKTVNRAVEETASGPARQAGLFGLLRAIGNADVRRSLGFALQVAAGLGAHLKDGNALPPSQDGRSLPS